MPPLAPPLTRIVMVPVLPLSNDGYGEDCSDGDGGNCWDDWLAQLDAAVIIPISGLSQRHAKSPKAFVEGLTDAACYTAKWLKSSLGGSCYYLSELVEMV